jgi:hypothetical protein
LPLIPNLHEKTITLAKKKSPEMRFFSGQEEFEDTKRVIRIRKSSKDRQYNRQKKTNSNALQNTTQKINDQAP